MLRATLILALLPASTAIAAPPNEAIAPDCRNMPGSFAWTLPTTRSMLEGETLVVAVGGNSHLLDEARVRLGSQDFARVDGGVRSPGNRAAIALFTHQLTANATLGTVLAVDLASSSAATEVCAQAVVFARGLAPLHRAEHQRHVGATGAATATATAADSGTVLTATWFPDAVQPVTGNGQFLSAHCAGGGSPCLVLASVDVVSAPTTVTVTPANDQRWSTALLALADPGLFSDSFE